jgi:hypothetical protein
MYFICCLFNDDVNILEYTGSNELNLKRCGKKFNFEILSRHISVRTEEIHEKFSVRTDLSPGRKLN